MNYRNLAGITVSEIGFGGWGIGGQAYGPTDDAVSLDALRCALDFGITFYDTCPTYGNSEELIGQAFEHDRDKVVLATKLVPGNIRKSVERSLKALRTDYIDLVQIRGGVNYDLLDWNELLQLRIAGKLRAVGISSVSPNDAIADMRWANILQVNLSMCDQRAIENGLLERGFHAGTGFIARTPFCFGYLAEAQKLAAMNDHRKRFDKEQHKLWDRARKIFSSDPVRALQFCLSFPIATVIPGMLTEFHVKQNVEASVLGPLADDGIAETRKVYGEHEFFLREA